MMTIDSFGKEKGIKIKTKSIEHFLKEVNN